MKLFFIPIITGAIGGYIANVLPGYLNSIKMSPKTELMLYIGAGIAIAYLVTWLYERYKKNREEDRQLMQTLYRQSEEHLTQLRNFTTRDIAEIKQKLEERGPSVS